MSTQFNRLRWQLLLSLSLAYSISGCLSSPAPSVSPSANPQTASPSISPSPATVQLLNQSELSQLQNSPLVNAYNHFAWQLFTQTHQAAPTNNHFISPVSVSLALSMVLQGAAGSTHSELAQALNLTAISPEQQAQDLGLLLQKLQRPATDIQLTVANSLWMDQQRPLREAFIQQVQHQFQAEAHNLDFAGEEVVSRINQWAKTATQGLIPEVLKQAPDPATVSYLLNAIYFKGSWKEEFDPAETRKAPFYLADGTTQDVQMMRRFSTQFRYLQPREAFPHQGVQLPYGEEEKVAFYAFLPHQNQTLDTLHKDLSEIGFENLKEHFYYNSGSLQLPRFKLEQSVDLSPILKQLGIKELFDNKKADLSRMSDLPVFVSGVNHLSFIEVNETGTEAAAITEIPQMEPSSEPSTVNLIFDRPFFFLIRDQETGQILFMGNFTQPQGEA